MLKINTNFTAKKAVKSVNSNYAILQMSKTQIPPIVLNL